MKTSRSVRGLLTSSCGPNLSCEVKYRGFHNASRLAERRRSRFKSIEEADLRKRFRAPPDTPTDRLVKPYNDNEKDSLSNRYTSQQLRVIEAGERSIPQDDLLTQATVRTDMYKLPYIDDLSIIKPVIDKKPRPRMKRLNLKTPVDDSMDVMLSQTMQKFSKISPPFEERMKDPEFKATADKILAEEGQQAFETWKADQGPSKVDLWKMRQVILGESSAQVGDENVLAPTLPKITAFKGEYNTGDKAGDSRDVDGKYSALAKQLGISLVDIFNLKVKILVAHRVTNQTRLGKIPSMYILAVAGNGDGRLGIGEGKASEVDDARLKARLAAIRNMKPIPRYESRTIYGESNAKVSAVEVRLTSRPPGFGLRCQHNIFEMARCAGIQDLAAKVPRSRNKMNTIKATFQALMDQRIPDEVARGRGKKLVDVRKVYYGGTQLRGSREAYVEAH